MSSSLGRIGYTLAGVAASLSIGSFQAAAQGAPNYAGKSLQFVIAAGVGGGYDQWGRTIARHMGRYLPGNPTLVPQNMPAGGGIAASNHLFTTAPRDGTSFGIITRDSPLAPMMGNTAAKFDPVKLNWLGTPTTEFNVCVARTAAGFSSHKDLYEKTLIVGDTGAGTGTHIYPLALNGLFGMKFKLITGFPSSADVFLAIERGEVDGICESLDSFREKRPDWVSSGKMKILLQGGAAPNPDLKDAAFVMDLAKTAEEKAAVNFLYAGQGIGRTSSGVRHDELDGLIRIRSLRMHPTCS